MNSALCNAGNGCVLCNAGLNGGVPWHVGTNGSLCLICKEGTEDVTHFLLDRPFFKENVDSVWLNIKARITETNPLMVLRFAISSVILTGLAKFCCCSGVSHCHLITRRQFLSKDLFHQQWEKSLNCIRINYVSWRLRGLKINEKAFLILLFN